MNIVEIASGEPQFSTLVAALSAAGLVDALAGSGPFTVFAPNDDAFGKLPAGAVDDLVKPENKDKLTALLKMHVVSGKHMAADFTGKEAHVATLDGTEVAIKGADGRVTVNGATVQTADIEASNGVIHVIDTVLTPAHASAL